MVPTSEMATLRANALADQSNKQMANLQTLTSTDHEAEILSQLLSQYELNVYYS